MVVIHVSGTSGSGKSWIGLLMKRIYPDSKLHVVDLDEIFRAAIHRHPETDNDKKFQQIDRDVKAHIARLRARHRNLLITGYSDVVVDKAVRYVELGADKKFFIEIPIKNLIQQYRWRASQHVMHTRHEAHSYSDDDLKKLAAKDRRVYRDFRLMTQAEIIKTLILELGR